MTILAVQIEPDYIRHKNTSYLYDYVHPSITNESTPMAPVQMTLPIALLQHHSVRDIQYVSLDFNHRYEVQVSYNCVHSNFSPFCSLNLVFIVDILHWCNWRRICNCNSKRSHHQ